MLVKGQAIRLIVKFLERRVEPMGKAGVDALDCFGLWIFAPTGRCAAATSLVWDGEGDALIKRGGQQCRFAESRVAHDCDPILIDFRQGDEIIDRAMNSPGPGGNRAPIVRPVLGAWFSQMR